MLLIGCAAICVTFDIIGGHDGWKALENQRNRLEAVGTNGQLWRGALFGAITLKDSLFRGKAAD